MPPPALLTRGSVTAQAIGAGANFDFPGPGPVSGIIPCEGDSELTVQVAMTGAASGDLAVKVTPTIDGVTPGPIDLPPVPNTGAGPTFAAGVVGFLGTYDVSGCDAVRVRLSNANVGAQTLNRASWRLS